MAGMWHEARKQERKIRGMLVDYKRRAERRREYYEKIKQDPAQFIQLHGRNCKIHLDPSIYCAAEAPGSMMPWRGDKDSMVDRFDVRAHLDYLPDVASGSKLQLSPEEQWEERQCNYERYRILIQNIFLGVKEEKFLHQIHLEELYGPVSNKSVEEEKKMLAPKKAAIGFNYTDNVGGSGGVGVVQLPAFDRSTNISTNSKEDSGDESDSDIDLDMTVDVMSLSNAQQQELNKTGLQYGLNTEDFMDLISRDLQEAEALRLAKEHEDEKAMYSGRKSRKERRALKKKHLEKRVSPPSYAARASPTYAPYRHSSSRSRSTSPANASQIKFITSFGGDSDALPAGEKDDTNIIILPKSAPCRSKRRSPKSHRGTSSYKSNYRKHRHSSSSRSSRSSSPYSGGYSGRRNRSRQRSRSKSRSWKRSGRRTRSPHSCSSSRSRSYSRSASRERYKYSKSSHPSKRRSISWSPSRSRSRSASHDRARRGYSPTLSSNNSGAANCAPMRLPSPPRRQYYGRREAISDGAVSEEESCDENSSNNSKTVQTLLPDHHGIGAANSKSQPFLQMSSKLTPQERLKKKMQLLLKKQYKADKKLEMERQQKAEQERLDREEELRELAIKMRKRERERRHRLRGEDSDSYSSKSDSSSGSWSRSYSRERSCSQSSRAAQYRSSGSNSLRSDTRARSRSGSREDGGRSKGVSSRSLLLQSRTKGSKLHSRRRSSSRTPPPPGNSGSSSPERPYFANVRKRAESAAERREASERTRKVLPKHKRRRSRSSSSSRHSRSEEEQREQKGKIRLVDY